MPTRIFGIAAAAYGREVHKFTASVVEGDSKEDTHVSETWTMPLDVRSLTSTREAFQRLLLMATKVGKSQREAHPTLQAPMVFGAPEGFPVHALERAIRAACAGLLAPNSNAAAYAKRRAKRVNVSADREPPWSEREAGKAVGRIGDIVALHLQRHGGRADGAVRFQPRSFGAQDLTGDDADMQTLRTGPRQAVDPAHEAWLAGLHDRAQAGDAGAMGELETFARESGQVLMAQLVVNRVSPETRFFQLGTRVAGYLGTHTHNYLRWFRLRGVFGQQIVDAMSRPHNIALKVPDDPPAPVFADVTTTYMGDLRDDLEGTQPGVVLARLPETPGT